MFRKNALMGSFIKKLIGKKNRGEKTNYFFRDYRHDSLPTQCPSWISTIAIAVKSRDLDILPSLKQMGFLDTNARNPDITIAGITLALQFGNALPKYITGRKNITVVD